MMDDDSSNDDSFEQHLLYDNVIDQGEDDRLQEMLLVALVEAILHDDDDNNQMIHGGSVPGKSRNINRNREAFDAHLNADYFDHHPTYSLMHFRQRFRMERSLYLQIEQQLQQSYRFFMQRADATGLLGISTRQKNITAIRMLAAGCSSDDVDDRSRIAESTMLDILDCFCAAIIEQYGEEFLREPTEDDLLHISSFGIVIFTVADIAVVLPMTGVMSTGTDVVVANTSTSGVMSTGTDVVVVDTSTTGVKFTSTYFWM
jgi:hypothetical protein